MAVLSDLFGIQARSGCFCAGPYIHRIHPIDDAWSAAMHEQARQGYMGATLGFSRVSFGYYISEAVFDYIVEAVHLLAEQGWKLLPLYRFDPRTGRWRHVHARPERPPGLRDLPFDAGVAGVARTSAPESALARQLDAARRIISAVEIGAADQRSGRPAAVTGVRSDPLVPAAGRGARQQGRTRLTPGPSLSPAARAVGGDRVAVRARRAAVAARAVAREVEHEPVAALVGAHREP